MDYYFDRVKDDPDSRVEITAEPGMWDYQDVAKELMRLIDAMVSSIDIDVSYVSGPHTMGNFGYCYVVYDCHVQKYYTLVPGIISTLKKEGVALISGFEDKDLDEERKQFEGEQGDGCL